jgi:enoyl-CoA hydratase/carnithine racemase
LKPETQHLLAAEEALADAILTHVPDKLIKRALRLANELNDLTPSSWTAARVEATFRDKDGKAAAKECEEMQHQLDRASGVRLDLCRPEAASAGST